MQLLLVVQQVHAFPAVNLKHRQPELGAATALSQLKQIVDRILRYSVDRESLTRASLPIGEARNYALVKNGRQQIPYAKLVHVLTVFILVKGVVELKLNIVYILRDAIYLYLGLVNNNLRVTSTG